MNVIMVWLIAVAALIFIVMIVLLFPVSVTAKYVYSNEKKQNIFEVKIFGICAYRFDKNAPVKEKFKKKKEKAHSKENIVEKDKSDIYKELEKMSYEDFRAILKNWEDEKDYIKEQIGKFFGNLKKLIRMRKIVCRLNLGFDDAAKTGIGAGAAYGVLFGIFSKLYSYFNMKGKNMDVCINPEFSKECVDLLLSFKFNVRIIFVVPVLLNLSAIYDKLTKNTKLVK